MKKSIVTIILSVLLFGFGVSKGFSKPLTLDDKQLEAFGCYFGYIEMEFLQDEDIDFQTASNNTIKFCSNQTNRQNYYSKIEFIASLLLEMNLMTEQELEAVDLVRRRIALNSTQRAAYACYVGVLGIAHVEAGVTQDLTDKANVKKLQDNSLKVIELCKNPENRKDYNAFATVELTNSIINAIIY